MDPKVGDIAMPFDNGTGDICPGGGFLKGDLAKALQCTRREVRVL